MSSEKNQHDNLNSTSEKTSLYAEDTVLDSFADDLLQSLPSLDISTDTTKAETKTLIQPHVKSNKGKERQIYTETPGLDSMQSISEVVNDLFEAVSPPTSPFMTPTSTALQEDELIQPTSLSRDGTVRFKKLSTLNAYENIEKQTIRLAPSPGKMKSNIFKKNSIMKPYQRKRDGLGDNRSNRTRTTMVEISSASGFSRMTSGHQRELYSNTEDDAGAPGTSSGHGGLYSNSLTFNHSSNNGNITDKLGTGSGKYKTLYSSSPFPFVHKPGSIFDGYAAESSSHEISASTSTRNISKSSDDMRKKILKYYQKTYNDTQPDLIDNDDTDYDQGDSSQNLPNQKSTQQDPLTQDAAAQKPSTQDSVTEDIVTQEPSIHDPPIQTIVSQEHTSPLDQYTQKLTPQDLPHSCSYQDLPQPNILTNNKIQEPPIFNTTTPLLHPEELTYHKEKYNLGAAPPPSFTTQDTILTPLSSSTINLPRKNRRANNHKLDRSRKTNGTYLAFSDIPTGSKHPRYLSSSSLSSYSSDDYDDLESPRKIPRIDNTTFSITLNGSDKATNSHSIDKNEYESIIRYNEVTVPQIDIFEYVKEPRSPVVVGLTDAKAGLALQSIAVVLGTNQSDMKTSLCNPNNNESSTKKLPVCLFPSVVHNIKNYRIDGYNIYTKTKLHIPKEEFLYDAFLGWKAYQEKENVSAGESRDEQWIENRRMRKMALSRHSVSQSMLFSAEEIGYTMTPSYETLIKMNKRELSSVRLKVGRKGYGEILYQQVNLVDVDLTLIMHYLVCFETLKEVVVYPDVTMKPAVGCGLNVPALVSLENCFGLRDPTSSRVRAFVLKLQKLKNTRFVSYEPGLAKWTFGVDHF